jgi:hypothetical protein
MVTGSAAATPTSDRGIESGDRPGVIARYHDAAGRDLTDASPPVTDRLVFARGRLEGAPRSQSEDRDSTSPATRGWFEPGDRARLVDRHAGARERVTRADGNGARGRNGRRKRR